MALSSAWGQLNALPDFDVALGIASASPPAAVMLAYADLEKVARAAWTVARLGPAGRESAVQIVRSLSESGGLDPDFAAVARNLATLRNQVAHGLPEASDVTVTGAVDFIAACEQVTHPLARNALSKLRHPSRSPVVHEWLEWTERQGLTDAGDNEEDDDPAA